MADWPAYFRWVGSKGGNARRLDVAMDDRSGLLDLDRIEAAWLAGHKSSHYREMQRIKKHDARGRPTGDTIYFGSRGSGSSVRIYNKALEQGLPAGKHWIRVEVEFRGDRANLAMRALAECQSEEMGRVIAELIRGCLRFVKGERSRRHRDELADWWAAFLGDVASRRLGSSPRRHTAAELHAWLVKQCAPAMAVVTAAYGGAVDWLYEAQADGRRRWRPHHEAMVVAAA
jgi:DNA relaxase NicK